MVFAAFTSCVNVVDLITRGQANQCDQLGTNGTREGVDEGCSDNAKVFEELGNAYIGTAEATV